MSAVCLSQGETPGSYARERAGRKDRVRVALVVVGLMARKVSLFFDCISPYTHISLSLWSRYLKVWPVDLTLRPFFLGGVMAATGNQPPGMLPAKGHFLVQDLARSAALYEVPLLETPSNFFDARLQQSALKVSRLLCAAQLDGCDDTKVLQLALAASKCLHADPCLRAGSELTINDSLMRRACADASLDRTQTQALLELAQGEATKQALRANTEEAVARGAFGSPTAFVHEADAPEAMFFGSDRMEQLAHHLGLPYHGARPTSRL